MRELDPEWLTQALGEAWEEQRVRAKLQLVQIERALAALDDHALGDRERRRAVRAAHTLAGAVAMFGFVRAAELACRLEIELAGAESDCAPALLGLTLAVRAEIDRPLRLARPDSLVR
jgi:HPt (histidine-containing phosphotransfer) domain-containing protein